MAVTPKPKRNIQTPLADVDAVIAKGGSIAQEISQSAESVGAGAFTLRVPRDLLRDLDTHRQSRRVKVSRQQWILEAIEQRLERENAESKE